MYISEHSQRVPIVVGGGAERENPSRVVYDIKLVGLGHQHILSLSGTSRGKCINRRYSRLTSCDCDGHAVVFASRPLSLDKRTPLEILRRMLYEWSQVLRQGGGDLRSPIFCLPVGDSRARPTRAALMPHDRTSPSQQPPRLLAVGDATTPANTRHGFMICLPAGPFRGLTGSLLGDDEGSEYYISQLHNFKPRVWTLDPWSLALPSYQAYQHLVCAKAYGTFKFANVRSFFTLVGYYCADCCLELPSSIPEPAGFHDHWLQLPRCRI